MYLVGTRQSAPGFEGSALRGIPLRMSVRNHQDKICIFETGKAHSVRHRPGHPKTQIPLPFANILQINSRREPGGPRKVTPRKSRTTLVFFVIILDILAIICIFNNFLHKQKYIPVFLILCTKIAFLSRFYQFCRNSKKINNIGYTQRIHWIQKKSPAEAGEILSSFV